MTSHPTQPVQQLVGSADELLGDALFARERYAEAAIAYAATAAVGGGEHLSDKLEVSRTNALVGAAEETVIYSPRHAERFAPASPPRDRRRDLLDRVLRLPDMASPLGDDAARTWTDWYHRPKALAILKLAQMRHALNRDNIFDTYRVGERPASSGPRPANAETVRTIDGTYNDLGDPTMGAAGVRFGRNVPPHRARTDLHGLLSPSPREISRRLMTRERFRPVPFLNLIAASWIQFMTHDWFSHGPTSGHGVRSLIEIPLAADDPLRHEHHTATMLVPTSAPDPSRDADEHDLPPTHLNEVTHWWDASQLYGSDEKTAAKLRAYTTGKLALDEYGRLPLDRLGIEETGFKRNWWVGLSMLHELFAREHNAICDGLKESYPEWTDQELYDTARMINAAQMAKIHTLEWTPAILANPVLERAMHANWSGLAPTRRPTKPSALARWAARNPELFGIVGGERELHGVPYSVTEEFVAVYRMHPLLPESLIIRPLAGEEKAELEEIPLARARQRGAAKLARRVGMEAMWNTFGHAHPGALTLHNYPKFLQTLSLPGLPVFDLAAVDVLRDRERGVPRYNEFRRCLGLKPIEAFEDLTDEAEDVARLHELYAGDVETLDLLVGCLAESHRPSGFGFGETAFQVFILNASRRLQADRFYTTHYTEAVYTREGLARIEVATMKDILLRHYPGLERSGLVGAKTAFHPWRTKETS